MLLWLNAIFILCSSSPAQNSTDVPGIDTLASRVKLFGETLPQEKVYLHIDNTCYFVGDTIWYKGYVTRSDKGTLTDLSRILYVELLTPDGYLVERQQLEMPDGTAHGAFLLTDSQYAGYYELRAYTRWMLNFGRYEHPHSPYTEEMFYNKQMAKDYFRDYDKLYSRVFPVFDRPSSPGIYPKDMTLRPLRRYFRTRKGKPDMDLKFYPEGGALVAGLPGHMAFELNDENGQHVAAEVTIYNRHKQIIARTHTVHRGRGTFVIPQVSAEESFLPEQMQTLTGSVHPTYSLLPEADYGELVYIPGMGKELPLYTTAGTPFSLDDLYGTTYSGKMKKEVTVTATFAQGTDIVEASQDTKGGRFTMLSPILHGDCSLFLTATDSAKFNKRKEKRNYKEFHDEEAYPDYYVKQDRFYPVFPKPYSYYHDAVFENMEDNSLLPDSLVSGTHLMSAVTVRNKRGGLRKLNLKKPTLVVDAYEAFNLAADYGLNCGMYDWRTFTKQVCTAYIGDMNQSRHYFIQERYDSLPLNHKDKTLPVGVAITNQTEAVRRKYHKLYNLDKLYIYTDYSPREENSWKYSGTDQPDVVVDYRLFPGEARQYTFRDRRYLMTGYSVCKDFYHPDYSRRPLPGTADYRRTLYWNPDVKFDAQGEAQLRFYNNGKRTALSIDAEGITQTGQPATSTLSPSTK